MASWHVGIDETGNLEDPDEPAALVAALCPGAPTKQAAEGLRRRLEQVYTGIPWPPHGNRLNCPAWPLLLYLAGRAPPDPLAAEACALPALWLRDHPLLELQREIERLRRSPGVEPSLEVALALWAHLRAGGRATRAATDLLRDLQQRRRVGFDHLLQQLAAEGRPVRLLVAYSPAGSTVQGAERYLQAWACLRQTLDRALEAPQPAQVLVHLADYDRVKERDLRHPPTRPTRHPRHALPLVFPTRPRAYHADRTRPEVVLADLLGGRVRRVWNRSWNWVKADFQAIGVPVEVVVVDPTPATLPLWASTTTESAPSWATQVALLQDQAEHNRGEAVWT